MFNGEKFEEEFGEPLCDELKGLLSRGLPKWTGLVVIGEPISLEQAEEVLIRTANFYFSTNDHAFSRELYKALNIPIGDDAIRVQPNLDALEEVQNKYGVLPLEYLNNYQVVSSYIGGPYGWCDWEGNIGCNTYNIGKWPSVEEVYREWKLIAAAFPFLRLKSQLLSGETSEGIKLEPIVQFSIGDGLVLLHEPEELLVVPTSGIEGVILGMQFFQPGAERGCTISKFKHALETSLKGNHNGSYSN